MKRREAREILLQILFQTDMTKVEFDEAIEGTIEEKSISESDLNFIKDRANGTLQNLQVIDEELSKYLQGWKLNRLARVDKSILRLAAYELMLTEDTSNSIVVNEAIELAKIFGSDESPKFINGVLGAMIAKSDKIHK